MKMQTTLLMVLFLIVFTFTGLYARDHSRKRSTKPCSEEDFIQENGTLTDHDHILLMFPKWDKVQLPITQITGAFQHDELKLAFAYLRDRKLLQTGIFFDIGANVGNHTVYAFQEPEIDRAISVEPSSINFLFLKKNIKLNHLTDKVQIFQTALGDFNGEIILSLNPDNCGDYRLKERQSQNVNLCHDEQFNAETVSICTLDKFIEDHSVNLREVALIWMDTQGSEGLILGSSQLVKNSSCPLYIEFWPYGMNKLNSYPLLREFILNEVRIIVRFIDGSPVEYLPSDIDKIYDGLKDHDHCDLLLIR